MKKFIDGDCMCFTYDDFVNLQESPAVFVSTSDVNVQAIIRCGLYAASGEFLVNVSLQLAAQQGVQRTPPTESQNFCNPVNGVHASWCTGHNTAGG